MSNEVTAQRILDGSIIMTGNPEVREMCRAHLRMREAIEAVRKNVPHREDTGEVCYDWCPRCKMESSLTPQPSKDNR